MRGPSRLFRQEALEHHAGGQRWGERLNLGSRWARRAPAGLVALAVPLAVAGLVIRVDDSASGRFLAGSDGSSVTAVLPATARASLVRGTPLDLRLNDGRRVDVQVTAADIQAVSADDARIRFGATALAGLLATSSPLILVRGSLDSALTGGGGRAGAASVRLDSRALIPMLVSGLFAHGPGG
jgi:hypothetical protein